MDRRSGRPSPRSVSKSNSISRGDSDDDSDTQAVRWMRDRSKRNSKDVVDTWIEKREKPNGNKASLESKKSPSTTRTSQLESSPSKIPNDTGGIKDLEMKADDTELIEMKMETPVAIDPMDGDNASDGDSASDADSETKARYIRAVNLLHQTILEKQESLTSTERGFLTHLLDSTDEEDRSSDIENAPQTLFPMFDAPPPPSPSRTQQDVSPPSRPTFRGVRLSVVSPIGRSSSGEAFELAIRGSTSMEESIDMEIDEPALITGMCALSSVSDGNAVSFLMLHLFSHLAEDESPPVYQKDDRDDEEEDSKLPFSILGQSCSVHSHVLTPLVLEALRGFLPFVVSEENFWLKFSLLRDGASLATLLHMVRASKWTIIGVETMEGDVFGSFTGTPWRKQKDWYGSGEAFLWRLKQSRPASTDLSAKTSNNNQMEIYPYTGADNLVQYCSEASLAVGGGDWKEQECPYEGEPKGIGLMVDRDLAVGETNSCATFANRRLCRRSTANNDFHISNMEVWTMTPCTSLEEAQKLESHKLFVEEHQRVVNVY